MEICDILDEAGMPTGRTAARGTQLAPGEYFLAVQVWIQDETGDYLVQRRALHLASGPGVWATTAGYVVAGEDSLSGAIREVREELGIALARDSLTRFDRLQTDHRIEDIWIACVVHELMADPLPGPEVCDWKWASKRELVEMIERGDFFPYSYFHRLPEKPPLTP